MQTYLSPKFLLLLFLGILLVARGITADEKTPPATLQIGISTLLQCKLIVGIKHHVPEEECTRKTKNGDRLKMHYR
jgi:hypothetical protein